MHSRPGPTRRGLRWAAAVLLGAAAAATAQTPGPHIGYVFPAGGQRGATFRIAVGGQQLSDVTNACVSGDGVTVRFIELSRTLNERQRASLAIALGMASAAIVTGFPLR